MGLNCLKVLVDTFSLVLLDPTVKILNVWCVQKTQSLIPSLENIDCRDGEDHQEGEDEQQEEWRGQGEAQDAEEGQVHGQVHQHSLTGQWSANRLLQ